MFPTSKAARHTEKVNLMCPIRSSGRRPGCLSREPSYDPQRRGARCARVFQYTLTTSSRACGLFVRLHRKIFPMPHISESEFHARLSAMSPVEAYTRGVLEGSLHSQPVPMKGTILATNVMVCVDRLILLGKLPANWRENCKEIICNFIEEIN